MLVDLLMQKELKRNGWSPHADTFYPEIEQNENNEIKKKDDYEKRERDHKKFKSNSAAKEKKKEKPKIKDLSLSFASQFNYEWIKKGKIFKRINEEIPRNGTFDRNRFQVLEDINIIKNDNSVVQRINMDMKLQEAQEQNEILIKENKTLKEKIEKTKHKEDELLENYEVESMTVETLQEHLKSLESDCMNLMKDGDAKIQSFKEEKHKKNLELHCVKKR